MHGSPAAENNNNVSRIKSSSNPLLAAKAIAAGDSLEAKLLTRVADVDVRPIFLNELDSFP